MLRKNSNEKNPEDWFAFAAERLAAADVLWKVEGLTAAGIELLQESVERYLKGYLIAKGWQLIKTHDLRRLIKEAEGLDHQFRNYRSFGSELTEDFFAQHYPGGDMTDVGENYESMRRQAGELVNLIKSSLPQHFPTDNPPSA